MYTTYDCLQRTGTRELNLAGMLFVEAASASGAVPCPRQGHTLTKIDENNAILFGGRTNSRSGSSSGGKRALLNDVFLLSHLPDAGLVWTELHPPGDCPSPRHNHAAIFFNSSVLVFGGAMHDQRYSNELFQLSLCYSPTENRWTAVWRRSHPIPE